MLDLLIKNARIYDGTGAPSYIGSVGVSGGKIAYIGTEDVPAKKTEDADGLSLSPGFIDVHSHSDQSIVPDPNRLHVLKMGATTEIAGQCGHGVTPDSPDMSPETRKSLHNAAPNASPLFPDMKAFREALASLPLGPHQMYFSGHGLIRGAVLGTSDKKASDGDIARMQDILRAEMRCGTVGISTGLSYVPGIYSDTKELAALARAAGEMGGMYVTHSRSESHGMFKSINECIDIARESGAPVNISHFKCVGKPFWAWCGRALATIDEAVAAGADITIDAYPYVATSTTTLSTIPPAFLTGGVEAFAESLADPNVRAAIRREIFEINDPSWDNSMYYVGLENFRIVRADATPWAVGKSYAEAAAEMGMDPFEGTMQLLRENHGTIYECRFSMCEENVEKILRHPLCMVGSDGLYRKGDLSAHPRAFGTFPRYLGYYVRERGLLSREEAIRRITGMPAERYGLTGKGKIAPGYDADLVLFDYDTIRDGGTFTDPFLPNVGIHRVYMDGEAVIADNEPTGVFRGRYLTRG